MFNIGDKVYRKSKFGDYFTLDKPYTLLNIRPGEVWYELYITADNGKSYWWSGINFYAK